LEHLPFLLIEFLLWLDRRSLKSLERAVPNLSELKAAPEAVLNQEEVVIGPSRRWGTGTALGLLVGLGFVLLGLILIMALGVRPRRRDVSFLLVLLIAAMSILTISVAVFLRLLQGGRLVLRSEGVEFQHGRTTVYCPWGLFRTAGTPFAPSKDRVLMPIDPGNVRRVEVRSGDQVLARGLRVWTKALKLKTASLAELRALYEVPLDEIAPFLVQVADTLGDTLPVPSLYPGGPEEPEPEAELAAVLMSQPVLVRRPDGWLEASLVQLTFPPYCCDCGAATADRKKYQGFASGFFDAGQSVPLEIPLCIACRQSFTRTTGWKVVWGVVLGFIAVLMLWTVLGIGMGMRARRAIRSSFAMAWAGAVMGGLLGLISARAVTTPVRLRDYRPSEGTILLWFRNPKYSEALMEILGGAHAVEESAPEDLGDIGQGRPETVNQEG
jgi:hypothetical protein